MGVTDGPIGQSRLDYARDIADQIASQLQGEMVSLYAFTSVLTRLSPPTNDILFLRLMLRQVQINEGGVGGTDYLESLKTLREKYLLKPPAQLKTIILLSDGGDTSYEAAQGEARQERLNAILSLAAPLKGSDLRIYSIAIGSAEGGVVPGVSNEGKPVRSTLDPDSLQSIAKNGNGTIYIANAMSAIDIAASLAKIVNQEQAASNEQISEKRSMRKK